MATLCLHQTVKVTHYIFTGNELYELHYPSSLLTCFPYLRKYGFIVPLCACK